MIGMKSAILLGILATFTAFVSRHPYHPIPIPSTMSAILTTGPHEISLVSNISTAPLIPTKSFQILVKMAYAPVNPSDVYHAFRGMNYRSKNKTYPYSNGYEGSGTIVASGGGFLPHLCTFFNINVAVAMEEASTWSEYVLVEDISKVFPLWLAFPSIPSIPSFPFLSNTQKSNMNVLLQGSAAFVNPLTALGFLETARELQEHSLVHTAANSALGKMLIRAANIYGIQIIAVVRGDHNEHELIHSVGHDPKLIIRSDVESFEEDLKHACQSLGGTRLVFDAIGGTFTDQLSQILKDPIPSSTHEDPVIYVYGNLSGKVKLFAEAKSKYPFWLLQKWMLQPGHAVRRMSKVVWGMTKMLKKELSTSFQHVVNLKDPKTVSLLQEYESYQKGGKIVIAMEP